MLQNPKQNATHCVQTLVLFTLHNNVEMEVSGALFQKWVKGGLGKSGMYKRSSTRFDVKA